MGTIRIERVPVQRYMLGLFGFDHLQLTFEDETDFFGKEDFWWVMEGVQEGSIFGGVLGVMGESGRMSLGVANGAYDDALLALIGTVKDRGGKEILSGSNAIVTWDAMAEYAKGIEDQRLPYYAVSPAGFVEPTLNSTSVIASLLWSIGVNINGNMPSGWGLSPGASTLIGSPEADDLTMPAGFNQIVAGQGNDQLHGADGNFFADKLYGGAGNDELHWSSGANQMHGGQSQMAYAVDGTDMVRYSGVGQVHIEATRYAMENKVADFMAYFPSGADKLFSIERIVWDPSNDIVTGGRHVAILERPMALDMQGNQGGHGDTLSMSESDVDLLFNTINDYVTVQTVGNFDQDAGYWAQSVEWLEGSAFDDRIYTAPGLIGVEGGAGDDTIDARLAAPFSGQSPDGYDIEIDGGEGDDTIIASGGRTWARGGSGADRFVLSTMSTPESGTTVEFVIDDADASDLLLVPYDYFRLERGDFDGSTLFQLAGAPFKLDGNIAISYFEWGATPEDQVHGAIEFTGLISYEMSGADLLITVMQGFAEENIYQPDPDVAPEIRISNVGEGGTEVHILVRDWSEGDLGISMPLTWDAVTASTTPDEIGYPGLHETVADLTGSSRFQAPLDERPDAHLPLEIAAADAAAAGGGATGIASMTVLRASFAAEAQSEGTSSDDILVANPSAPALLSGLDGNDDLTGTAGGDALDGGGGADILRGGRGNDTYFVDHIGDQVVEADRGGFDHVFSSIDYALGSHVEHLTLQGAAVTGTGNDLRNRLAGNALDNQLASGAGDDTIAGNGGDDTLDGGAGSDGYVYQLGDGRDLIIDTADGGLDEDMLVLVGDMTAADVTLVREASHANDLVFAFADGGRVTVQDYYLGNGAGIDGVTFLGGDTWTSADLAVRAAAAVGSVAFAPTATDDIYTYRNGNSLTLPVAALLDNDRTGTPGVLSVIGLENITGGTATLDDSGHVVITHDGAGPTPVVSFEYVVAGSDGLTARARCDITFAPAPANSTPVVSSVTLPPVLEDTPVSGAIIASDADGDTLSYAVKDGAGPTLGSVSLAADGTFLYTPHSNVSGADSFTVVVSDGHGGTTEQAVAVSIAAVNDGPVANADSGFVVTAGTTLRITASQLLGNDTDIDGDSLTLASVTSGSGGTVMIDSNSDVLLSAGPSAGAAQFSYVVSDGAGGTASATVALTTLAATATRPVLVSASLDRVVEDQPAHGRIVATDADGDTLSYSLRPGFGPARGDVVFNADGTFIYTPDANANGSDRFTVLISDGTTTPVAHTFRFNIAAVNDAPLAVDDLGFAVEAGDSLRFSAAHLLANDSDIDGNRLTILRVTDAVGGTVHRNGNGVIVFDADDHFSGAGSFSYVVSDGRGGTDTATVIIDITADDDHHGHGNGHGHGPCHDDDDHGGHNASSGPGAGSFGWSWFDFGGGSHG